jgi:hypothetical protein
MTGATVTARKKGGARSKRTRHIPYKSDKGIHTEGPQSDINVTPLVDVCLVLLIIFMVVTPMLGRGKDVALPILTAADQHKEGDQVFRVGERRRRLDRDRPLPVEGRLPERAG